MKLKIIHTNDVHSNFENFSRAASLIKQYKDDHTLLLEAGDFADFKSIELQGTKGMAAIEVLDYLGYDALTIGNNEMFNGIDTLEYMASNSPIPFVSNNLLKKDKTKINGVVTSTIIEKSGVRIFITGSSPDLSEFNDGLGVSISDYKEALVSEIRRNKGNYDLCLILNHVGTFVDEVLAEELDDIDVIISAHDHQLYNKAKVMNGTILNSAGCYGEYVGMIELEINENKVDLLHSANISTKEAEVDGEVVSILKRNKQIAVEVLSQPLYEINQALWHDVIEENPITNLIADGLRDMVPCDFGLINSGIVNAGVFNHVSNKKLIEICPSPLNPTSFEIQGKFVREALEQSLDAQVCLADGRGPGFRGKFVGSLHVSGADILYDGKEIKEIFIGDKPLEEDRYYTVATSDYLHRGSGYEALANNRNVKYLPDEMRDVIRIYAEKPEFVDRAMEKRWKRSSVITQ